MATYKAKNKAGIGPKTKKQQRASDQEPTPMQREARYQAQDIRASEEIQKYFDENPHRVYGSPESLAKMSYKQLMELLDSNQYAEFSKFGVESEPIDVGLSMEEIKENERKIWQAIDIKDEMYSKLGDLKKPFRDIRELRKK